MVHPNAETIDRFYRAFASRDAEAMAACYHDRVVFSDPVFTRLEGEHARNMWRMLVARGTDLTVEHSAVTADDTTGAAHWEARYSFGPKRRKVHNKIDARFRFEGGLIIEHTDRFDLWQWAWMALGPPGLVLGWTPPLQAKIRGQASRGLEQWERGP